VSTVLERRLPSRALKAENGVVALRERLAAAVLEIAEVPARVPVTVH
jgi:hypothetical protein